MDKKTMDKIVWWIPFKGLRKSVRNHLKNKDFKNKFNEVKDKLPDGRFEMKWEDKWPCLDDNTSETGFEPHYTYHVAWAARIIADRKIKKLVDYASSLNFVITVSAFVPIDFYDIRPLKINLKNLNCLKGSLMSIPLEDNSVDAISCMHVIEHVGLERYGDDFDPKGDIKAINELIRVTKQGGIILFVVPMGEKAVIRYNGHRVYDYDMIMDCFKKCLRETFSFVKDDATFIENANKEDIKGQKNGCGCFLFIKK